VGRPLDGKRSQPGFGKRTKSEQTSRFNTAGGQPSIFRGLLGGLVAHGRWALGSLTIISGTAFFPALRPPTDHQTAGATVNGRFTAGGGDHNTLTGPAPQITSRPGDAQTPVERNQPSGQYWRLLTRQFWFAHPWNNGGNVTLVADRGQSSGLPAPFSRRA